MAGCKKALPLNQKPNAGRVCGGIAEYFGCDPTLIRLIYVALSLFTVAFPGSSSTLSACLIIPNDPGLYGYRLTKL